jgi:hypothetical protein
LIDLTADRYCFCPKSALLGKIYHVLDQIAGGRHAFANKTLAKPFYGLIFRHDTLEKYDIFN